MDYREHAERGQQRADGQTEGAVGGFARPLCRRGRFHTAMLNKDRICLRSEIP